MTHITLSRKTASKPSLEFYSDTSGEPRRVTIEQFPFRIGRADTADLRVESPQVSREHAEILERGGLWVIRDLGSMNGTVVNGKAITEALLADGDILTIAEAEFTFTASSASQFQRMVTQPIPSSVKIHAPQSLPPEVAATRALTEATLWQAIPVELLAVASLRSETIEAVFARTATNSDALQLIDPTPAVADRYRELSRMRAAELAAAQAGASQLFFGIDAAEIESTHRWFSSLEQIRGLLPDDWELGITVSLPTDVDILRINETYREARDLGLLVAFDEFQGNGGQVMHLESLLPDYLVLSAGMTRDLTTTRQPLRRLESLFSACEELAIKPVLARTDCSHTMALCREIGYDLVLQSLGRTSPKPGTVCAAAV